jgi:competence protein ComEC
MPNGKSVLIDGGEKSMGNVVLSTLQQHGISKLDVIVATHPHRDHIAGLIPVMSTVEVGQILDSGQQPTTQVFEDYLNTIETRGIPFRAVHAGENINLDPLVTMEILNPPSPLLSGTNDDISNNSIVIKLTYDNFSAIFPGDITDIAEESLLGEDLDVDVLLAAHHGSGNSNTMGFLNAATPEAVVVYAGLNNRYGHPNQESIDRINSAGVNHLFITYEDGTITLTTNGQVATIETATSGRMITIP